MSTQFYRISEISRLTRLPVAWLKREADAGRLPCIRAGRRRMFDLEAVLKSLRERQESGVSDAR